jgi:hypothetical protein
MNETPRTRIMVTSSLKEISRGQLGNRLGVRGKVIEEGRAASKIPD